MMANHKIQELDDSNFTIYMDSTKLPTLVDFWAPWCGPCRMFNPVLNQIAEASEGKFNVVKVNVDDSPLVSSFFSIRKVPTLMIFNKGKMVGEFNVFDKNIILNKMNELKSMTG
jgi:thioredoxin 1